MSTSKSPKLKQQATSNDDENSFAFQFKFPPQGLSLRSVSIEANSPMLIFEAADPCHSPTLTEEDVAVVSRLVEEGTRPEFCYVTIPPLHPFHGRQYKQYYPQWLRGTSVGDLLSETDWSMKCLSIGARSNDDKTQFWAWQKTSKLEGLSTIMDFPINEENCSSIKMSCRSIKVEKTEEELKFVGEPKMTIQVSSRPTYSDYITNHYDSIAHYDEPLFLKMKELIKLILAMEWLKRRGIKFNRDWIMEHTKKNRSSSSKAIEIVDATIADRLNTLTDLFSLLFPINETRNIPTPFGHISTKMVKLEKGFTMEVTMPTAPNEESVSVTLRCSVNDYDMVYNSCDPKGAFCTNPAGQLISPDVETWSELFAETVPWPMVWLFSATGNSYEIAINSGGVSTREIPVTEIGPTPGSVKTCNTEPVKASISHYDIKGDKVGVKPSKFKSESVPPLPDKYIKRNAPSTSPSKTIHAERKTQNSHVKAAYGWKDNKQICMSMEGEASECRQHQLYMSVTLHESTSEGEPQLQQFGTAGTKDSPNANHDMSPTSTTDVGSPSGDQNSFLTLSQDLAKGSNKSPTNSGVEAQEEAARATIPAVSTPGIVSPTSTDDHSKNLPFTEAVGATVPADSIPNLQLSPTDSEMGSPSMLSDD